MQDLEPSNMRTSLLPYVLLTFSLIHAAPSDNSVIQKTTNDLKTKITRLDQRLRDLKASNDELRKMVVKSAKEAQRCQVYLDEEYATLAQTPELLDKMVLVEQLIGDSIDHILPMYKDIPSSNACAPEAYIQALQNPDAFRASSQLNSNHAPVNSKLSNAGPQGWIPSWKDNKKWIQVSFAKEKTVSAVATRPRGDNKNHYVTKYNITYSDDGKNWKHGGTFQRVWMYPGKNLQTEIIIHPLKTPFKARYVRLYPLEYKYLAAVRWELYGPHCKKNSEIAYIASSYGDGLSSSNQFKPKLTARFSELGSSTSWSGTFGSSIPAPWIQMDLRYPREVIAVATQGRGDDSAWTSTYVLMYGNSTDNLTAYNKGIPLNGNMDQESVVVHDLTPFVARYVRLLPKTFRKKPALRWELYGPAREIDQECLW